MKKKVFLTGGSGLVGSALTDTFASQNFDLIATYRTRKTSAEGVTWVKCDFNDSNIDLHTYLKDIDIIIHNAASVKEGRTGAELEELKSTNVDFTDRLLKAASAFDIKKIIFTSSFSFISKPLPKLITENSNVHAISAYAESKYIGEQLVLEHCAKYGIQYNICRISSPISFDINLMPENVVKKWISQSIQKQPFTVYGKGQRRQDFVSVTDIAQAYLNMVTNNVSGIFNIASGSTISMLELAQLIAVYFKNKFDCINVDENEQDRWNISIEKAKMHLGYQPIYTAKDAIMGLLDNLAV